MKETHDFTQGKIFGPLIRFALPVLLALLCGIVFSVAVSLAMAYATFFHGEILVGLFAREPEVIAAASEYLKAYTIDCLLTSFLFCFIGYFNGCGCTVFVMIQGIVGAFSVRILVS